MNSKTARNVPQPQRVRNLKPLIHQKNPKQVEQGQQLAARNKMVEKLVKMQAATNSENSDIASVDSELDENSKGFNYTQPGLGILGVKVVGFLL